MDPGFENATGRQMLTSALVVLICLGGVVVLLLLAGVLYWASGQ